MRHASVWFDRFPKSRRPEYARLRGEQAARVAIVGGGLTGAACALSLAAAGIDAIVLEAAQVGGGLTAGEPGVLREGLAGSFREVAARHGLRTARAAWETARRGALDFAAALRRYRIKCDLLRQDLVTFAGPDAEAGRLLRREYQARRDAGLTATWLAGAALKRETALDSAGALRTRAVVIDPYKACVGLMAVAASRGAQVFERSPVRRIRPSKRHVDVQTEGGSVRVETVIVTTGAPIQDLRGLRRHLPAAHVYGVLTEPLPALMGRQVGLRRTILEPWTEAGRTVRWLADGRALLHGAPQPEVAARNRERALVQRTGQMMYEFSLLYPGISGLQPWSSWDAVDYETVDGLPLAGPHRNYPHHLFAFGSSRHGAGIAWTAARLLLRHLQGDSTRDDAALGFPRIR